MDIDEPVCREDTFYEDKLPQQTYGRPISYKEHVFSGLNEHPSDVESRSRETALYYGYGEKQSEKLESSPSERLPALSIDSGDDHDEDDDNTDGAHDPENPDSTKIKISTKSDDAERASSAMAKRDCRRVGGAILLTVIIMLCIFLPVLLTRRSPATAPPPAPVQVRDTPQTSFRRTVM
jgi:hypothetical protein